MTGMLRRLRLAGSLVSAGLLIESVTLAWPHPTAFLVFVGIGGTLVISGIALYLWSLTS